MAIVVAILNIFSCLGMYEPYVIIVPMPRLSEKGLPESLQYNMAINLAEIGSKQE